ncbi:MAG: hypothetical protein IID40_02395, partial [Planctomycetes bacterium]|nr:hypothetical protein [Planctomycetota bacterium]
MGQVYMGPPQELVRRLQEACGLTQFIETGTYQGHTARWAATCFDRVVTIEYAKVLWEAATAKWGGLTNVEFVWGDSRRLLRSLVPGLSRPAVFWLDAHWSGGDTYGEGDECPLLAELEIILGCRMGHLILIDDARLFTAAPPPPHVPG